MTGGKLLTNDSVDVRERARLDRGSVLKAVAVAGDEPGEKDGLLSPKSLMSMFRSCTKVAS